MANRLLSPTKRLVADDVLAAALAHATRNKLPFDHEAERERADKQFGDKTIPNTATISPGEKL